MAHPGDRETVDTVTENPTDATPAVDLSMLKSGQLARRCRLSHCFSAAVGIRSLADHVRYGSLADISERIKDVRFTPESGHVERQHRRPLSAISGHW